MSARVEELPYRAWWDAEHEVVRVDWQTGAGCNLDDARSARQAVQALARPGAPLLVDMRGMTTFERAAREHFNAGAPNVPAIAILIGNPATRMMANFFIGMRREGTPVKLFDGEDEALSWLHEQAA